MSDTKPVIVIDSNVFVSALRSRDGLSFHLLSLIGRGYFDIAVSVPLVIEYESAAKRLIGHIPNVTDAVVNRAIVSLCSAAIQQLIHYLWRPTLRDPRDELVLELAVAAQNATIVTYNVKDFRGAEQFGVRVIRPREFLEELGFLP